MSSALLSPVACYRYWWVRHERHGIEGAGRELSQLKEAQPSELLHGQRQRTELRRLLLSWPATLEHTRLSDIGGRLQIYKNVLQKMCDRAYKPWIRLRVGITALILLHSIPVIFTILRAFM